jgi:hypothetical protein
MEVKVRKSESRAIEQTNSVSLLISYRMDLSEGTQTYIENKQETNSTAAKCATRTDSELVTYCN